MISLSTLRQSVPVCAGKDRAIVVSFFRKFNLLSSKVPVSALISFRFFEKMWKILLQSAGKDVIIISRVRVPWDFQ
jgi:hypothetical protein